MSKLDQLLQFSTSQHGYWLVNHRSIILGDLLELLNKEGYMNATLIVNDHRGSYMKALYRKIEERKK